MYFGKLFLRGKFKPRDDEEFPDDAGDDDEDNGDDV
jgi:hypothetical protein